VPIDFNAKIYSSFLIYLVIVSNVIKFPSFLCSSFVFYSFLFLFLLSKVMRWDWNSCSQPHLQFRKVFFLYVLKTSTRSENNSVIIETILTFKCHFYTRPFTLFPYSRFHRFHSSLLTFIVIITNLEQHENKYFWVWVGWMF
jgi:hypothetical protein